MNKFKLTIFMVASLLTVFLSACKKDATSYTCTTCKTTPDALAANDNSSKGVYKGIVIGSSGTIMFDVMNSGSTITATLVIDGVTTTLTSNVVWSGNSAYVGNFTGTMNGSPVSIKLSLNIDGSDPMITSSDIPGHPNATFDIIKETSQNLVECFEGTYETDKPETGVFNLLLSRTAKIFGGRSRKTGSTETNGFSGIITSANELKDNKSGIIFGTLTGDVISGTFKD
ncbi:MAG: hypothetical protein IPK03_09260 [Bacteroidetes bacterium]|nr:hypothetical protein [Bacteroidota bacterium]